MKPLFAAAAVGLAAISAFGQNALKPELSGENNFSVAQQLAWEQKASDWIAFEEWDGDSPFTESGGCSWYCGGEMYKVTSDPYLPANGKTDYRPDNAHDFDLQTAWIPEGGIGKKINFHFKPLSPRVNTVIIYNGYIKNYDLFKSNARVREFKLYIDGKFYATLELADTTAAQSFKIDAVRSNDKNKDLILTLEIAGITKAISILTSPSAKSTSTASTSINQSGRFSWNVQSLRCFP